MIDPRIYDFYGFLLLFFITISLSENIFWCIVLTTFLLKTLVFLRKSLPPSQVNLSDWRLMLSWQPQVLPVGVGKQNKLQYPFPLEQLVLTRIITKITKNKQTLVSLHS